MSYPGDEATVPQLLELADCYRAAAGAAQLAAKRGKFASRAPARLLSIHAIELYLNALLVHRGTPAGDIRAMGHCLATRIEHTPLRLRHKTLDHLKALRQKQEYVVVRYSPALLCTMTHPTRLAATLDEVCNKVKAQIGTIPAG